MELTSRKCTPCRGGTPKLGADEIAGYLAEVHGWEVRDDRLRKTLTFPDFAGAMQRVNAIAGLAEREDHHPDFCVHYNRVELTIWTHAIGGLSENDFILAAKIDSLG